MTVILYNSDESESINDTNVWVTKLSVSGNTRNTPHKIFVSCEYAGNATNKISEIRVLIDGIERSYDYQIPQISNNYKKFCDFGEITFPTEATHTLELQFRSATLPQITKIRRARINIEQH
jgi:hypothetical protein